jgi:hypothetical protein
MNESDAIPDARARLKRLSKLRLIAQCILHGPRAVMFPDDPKGMKVWFEPILRMKAHFTSPRKSESVAIYSIPNCLQREPTSPVLIRRSSWEAGKDKDLVSNKGEYDWPTIGTTFNQLPEDQLGYIDKLLRQLDESLIAFPFPAEGLDLSGPSGFTPLPDDAVIVTNTVHKQLCRTTRFGYVEIHWTPVETNLSTLDRTWQTLFEVFINLSENSSAMVDIVEKYDVDPRDYGKLLKSESS